MIPESDWLAKLLRPFSEPAAIAVTGHTFLGYGDLVSRTFALMWVFPLREHDQRALDRRPLVANNSAFRSKWLKDNLFPVNDGFKVSCTLLARRLQDRVHALIRVPAKVSHAPLTGFRLLGWRALVTGRDADRKVIALKGKKVFIVNVASKCGFTPQYASLQMLHEMYGDSLEVLGFPSNDFFWQEPGTNNEIKKFCHNYYGLF